MPTSKLNRNLNGFERRLPEISRFGPMSRGESPACTPDNTSRNVAVARVGRKEDLDAFAEQ